MRIMELEAQHIENKAQSQQCIGGQGADLAETQDGLPAISAHKCR